MAAVDAAQPDTVDVALAFVLAEEKAVVLTRRALHKVGGGSGDGVPWASEVFNDTGYLLLGAASAPAFVAAFGKGGEGVDLNLGEPYLGLVKGPTAGGSGKPAAIVLGVGGMGADAGGKLTLTLNGKRLHIPFQAFCDWATQNLGAAVEEI